jgi:hypothetical protein
MAGQIDWYRAQQKDILGGNRSDEVEVEVG